MLPILPTSESLDRRPDRSPSAEAKRGLVTIGIGIALLVGAGFGFAFIPFIIVPKVLVFVSFAFIAAGAKMLPRKFGLYFASFLLIGGIASYLYGVTKSDNVLFLLGGIASGLFGGIILGVILASKPAEEILSLDQSATNGRPD